MLAESQIENCILSIDYCTFIFSNFNPQYFKL